MDMLDRPHVGSVLEYRLAELCAHRALELAHGVHCVDLRPFGLTLTVPGLQPDVSAPPFPVDDARPPDDEARPPDDEARPSTSADPTPRQPPCDAVQRVRSIAHQRSAMEARLLGAAQDLTAEIGAALLADKGYADVDELTPARRRKWAETKRLACAELQVALGLGVREARQLVGVACAPAPVRTVVAEALETGLASWGHVRAFWERCGTLPADEAPLVSESLFGADPDLAVPERLAPDGTLLDRPWHQAEFWAALEREAVRVEGQDVLAERERRHRARAERRVWMRVDDDSTATLAVTGPLTSVCAISQRIDACAKALRKSGDERTLAQLRSDVAQTLLLHGRLDLPGRAEGTLTTPPTGRTLPTGPTGDPLLTPAESEAVAQIVTAQPSITLEVVVPFDALTGQPACT